tara:strand:- start:2362 stop:2583 length:222 start_codon:yes stop_codon:yes gene_type:complete
MSSKEPTTGEISVMLKYMTESLDELHKKADYTNGKVRENTEYRLRQDGVISFFKWVGAGNLIAIVVLYVKDLI